MNNLSNLSNFALQCGLTGVASRLFGHSTPKVAMLYSGITMASGFAFTELAKTLSEACKFAYPEKCSAANILSDAECKSVLHWNIPSETIHLASPYIGVGLGLIFAQQVFKAIQSPIRRQDVISLIMDLYALNLLGKGIIDAASDAYYNDKSIMDCIKMIPPAPVFFVALVAYNRFFGR